MKRFNYLCAITFAAILSLSSISCRYQLVEEPTVDKNSKRNVADYENKILPPAIVNASHGGYRNITLNWSEVENAVQYQVYAAATPFDTFEQIGETKGTETNISIDVDSGYTYYFAICAVNYYGTVSSKSILVTGSSLAIPIITNIQPSEDAQSVTINWWMDNCSPETYANNLEFNISTYDKMKKPILAPTTVSGSARSAEISGLSAKSEYYFMVEAKLKDSDQKTEKSDMTNADTTHSVVPKMVEDFTSTQGISKDYVELSWKLPEGVDYYDSATNSYPTHPVMFVVQRKLLNSDDSTYENIAAIGTRKISEENDLYKHFTTLDYWFDCLENTTSSENIKIDTSTADSSKALDSYTEYLPGTTLKYYDRNAKRGEQYTYRVISYTDDTEKQLSAKSSITTSLNGWKIAVPTFKATGTYTKDENGIKFTKIEVNFKLDFKAFDSQYHYIITQAITDFKSADVPNPVEGEQTIVFVSESMSSLTSKVITFDLETESEKPDFGKYKYRLYITDKNSNDFSNSYEMVESGGTMNITDNAKDTPVINNFKVIDGYSDKFILSWDYDKDCSYILTWYENDNQKEFSLEDYIPVEDLTISEDGKTATYSHAAKSGDVRKYSLTASNGLESTQTYEDSDKQAITSETLGTPVLAKAEIDYSTITVTWPSVQMADGYEVSAIYKNDYEVDYDNAAAALGQLIKATGDDKNIEITENEGVCTCVITNPAGYNDATISGLPIDFVVTAKNDTTRDSTNASEIVKTLGPALSNPQVGKTTTKNTLSFSWNAIDGASKYLIYRTLYKLDGSIDSTDVYTVTGTQIETEQDIGTRASVTNNNGVFTLTDRQEDAQEIYGYQLNQEKIQWGLPYGYVVLPIKDDTSKFQLIEKTLTLTDTSTVNYGTLKDIKTSTFGYGLNIIAKKAESASGVVISWDAPNNKNVAPTVYRMRFNKEENHDYGSLWEKVATLTNSTTEYTDSLSNTDISSAFVYAVEYNADTGSNFVKSYRDKLLKTLDTAHSPTEQLNKGYLLTLKDFNAAYGGPNTTSTSEYYYQENVSWNSDWWDYKERALGPDSFTIDMKNKNLSSTMGWYTVAQINNFNTKEITLKTEANTTINKADTNNSIYLRPVFDGDNCTQGLLKVLRDAKHYYSANLTRGTITVRQAEDESIFAYRQITDEELCKCVSLIIADKLYQLGIPTHAWTMSDGFQAVPSDKGDEKFRITHYSWKNWCVWKITDYQHIFDNGASSLSPKSLTSFLSLNSNESSKKEGIKDYTLFYLPPIDIDIKSEIPLSSYSTTITFSAGKEGTSKNYSLSISKNNNNNVIVIDNNQNELYNWFPYDLGNKHISADSTLNTALKTYQSPWWN